MEEVRGDSVAKATEEKMPETKSAPATPSAPTYNPEELKEEITRVVRELFFYLGVKPKLEIQEQGESFYVNARLRARAGFLIGKKGQTLLALQYLATEILRKKYPYLPPIVLDISGYRMRRINFLKKKALAIARVVMETKREMAFDFLTPRELKIVADALAEIKEVKIYTIGTGTKRNVIIAPKS